MNGVVVDQETKQPLAGVSVQIIKYRERSEGPVAGSIGGIFRATTGPDGTFTMQPVPGVYHANLGLRGYSDDSDQPLEPLDIPEQLTKSVSFSMWRLPSVGGVVLNAEGKPAPDVDVGLIVVRPLGMVFPLPLRAARTDAEGAFLFSGVGPGAYTLIARPPVRMKTGKYDRTAFPTFLGDVVNFRDANKIVIRPGHPPEPLRIHLQSGQPAVLRGLVTDQRGQAAANSKVMLYSAEFPTRPISTTTTDQDGRFELDHLAPGSYRLEAELRQDGVTLGSEQAVTAAAGPVEANLRLSPPFSLEAKVEGDTIPGELMASSVVRLRLIPADETARDERITGLSQNGTFRWDGVRTGRYMILPSGRLPGFYEESVKLMNRDVLGEPVHLEAGYGPVTVVYREGPGGVRGSVTDQQATRVVLVPVEETLRNQQFIRIATAQAGARFELTDVRPGEYFAWAFDRLEPSRLEETFFVAKLQASARRVTIQKRAVSELDLKTTIWPAY